MLRRHVVRIGYGMVGQSIEGAMRAFTTPLAIFKMLYVGRRTYWRLLSVSAVVRRDRWLLATVSGGDHLHRGWRDEVELDVESPVKRQLAVHCSHRSAISLLEGKLNARLKARAVRGISE
jgi:hypothetical protein